MANKIIIKRSSVAGNVPAAGALEVGELAVNLADAKLYTKNAGGTVIQLGGGSGSGDVVGPSSATDNALVRFDGTTGKLIQNGTITQDDNGNLSGILSETYNTVTTPPAIVEGLEAWDSGNGTLELGLKGGIVSYKYGQQEYLRAYNGSGSAMTVGQVVYIVGAQGNRVDVRLAKADSDTTSASTIGFVAEPIANGGEGFVLVSGNLPKLDTSTLTAGATLYLSPTTAGAYTTTAPTAPNHRVVLGWVERVSATVGSFYVKVDNGYELDELHNVLITSPTTGQQLVYNSTTGVWSNSNAPTITGGSITLADGSFTLQDNTDPTKQARFELSSIGTGVTATYTLPPISSNLLNNSSTQTVDGIKTFSSATQNVGSSTATSTNNFAYGATISGATKTVNIGTNGVSGSTTNINLGSSVSGATTTVNAWGTWTFNTPLANSNLANSSITINGTAVSLGGSTSVGTVTGVTATSPVSSSGGTAPVISLSSGYGDTQNPYASKTANFFLAAPNGSAGAPTFRAIVAADIPTLNQNTTGTASNVTGTVAIANGGTGATTNSGARTNLGATTLGSNLFTITNPSAVTFPRFNADNTVSSLSATDFRTAIGAGTGNGNGTVTSVSGTGTVAGLTLTGTVTSSGSLTLGGNLSITADMIYDSFTATASQTTFTTSQTYTANKIEVFVNGVKMVNGAGNDVTVSGGTSVVMAFALTAGDRVDLVYPI